MIQTVGASWMMTTLTQSADMVTLVTAASAVPIVLLSALSGAIADNFERRYVMLVAQTGMLAVSLLLVAASAAGILNPWLLLAFTVALGIGTALHTPSWQASFADLVPREHLPAAVSLNGLGFNITRGIGPAIGGMIVAALGAPAAFAVNAVSYIPMIVNLLRWRRPDRPRALPRESLLPAVNAGLRYVAMSPNLQAILLRAFVFGFSVVPVLALLPILVRDLFDGTAIMYGLLFGAFGLGGIAGALGSGHIRARLSTEATARSAFVGFAACATLLSLSPGPWLSAIALTAAGALWVITLSMFNVCVQLSTPRWVAGRALSLYHTANFGGQASGAWVAGMVAQSLDVRSALLAAVAPMLAGAVLGVGRFALPAHASPNLDPSNHWHRPAVDVVPRSGPIKIFIEYLIDEKDLQSFLTTMEQRKRIRRRDGARDWTLLRDLEHPVSWVESYRFPTWLDYVRYHERTTLADSHVSETLRAMHIGPGLPAVRRTIERQTGSPRHDPGHEPMGGVD